MSLSIRSGLLWALICALLVALYLLTPSTLEEVASLGIFAVAAAAFLIADDLLSRGKVERDMPRLSSR